MLKVYSNEEDFKRDLNKYIPSAYKRKQELIDKGVEVFCILDKITTLLVPQDKGILTETKRKSAATFLQKRSYEIKDLVSKGCVDSVSESTLEEHILDLNKKLTELNDSLSFDDLNIFQKGRIEIQKNMTQKQLNNKIQSMIVGNIDSFVALLENVLEKSFQKERDISKIKDSVELLVDQHYLNKNATGLIEDFLSEVERRFLDIKRFNSESDNMRSLLKEYKALLLDFNKSIHKV